MVGFKETIQIYKNQVIAATQDSINYKKRIDKAVELIEALIVLNGTITTKGLEKIVNILKGED